jgi:hypothetical protein
VPDLSPITTFTFGKHQEQLHRIIISSKDALKPGGQPLEECKRSWLRFPDTGAVRLMNHLSTGSGLLLA